MQVLVVDDVPLNRALLRRTLEVAGAACVVDAPHGQAAYDIYQAAGGPATFALILMDCRMPVMDGWQATEHIRMLEQSAGWAPVPIIACTTEDLSLGSFAQRRCWACGMSAATGKPLSKDAAMQLLQRWGGSCFPDACRTSDSSTTCMLGDSGAPRGVGSSHAALHSAQQAAAGSLDGLGSAGGRSSLDSEAGCLPFRLRSCYGSLCLSG